MAEVAPKIGSEQTTEPPHLRLVLPPLETLPPKPKHIGPEYWAQFADKKAAKLAAAEARRERTAELQLLGTIRKGVIQNAARNIGKIVTVEYKDGSRLDGVCSGPEFWENQSPRLSTNNILINSPEIEAPSIPAQDLQSLEICEGAELPFVGHHDNT